MLAAGDKREHGGNDGYDDAPSEHYSWDSTVANRDGPQPGHIIVLRDDKTLLGVSVIDKVVVDTAEKQRYKCPRCALADFKPRSTKTPKFICKCGNEFDEPVARSEVVTTYRTDHAASWVDLRGELSTQQLRDLCVSPKSQLSIRAFRFDDFVAALKEQPGISRLTPVRARIAGGHRKAVVRVRKGQGQFRADLLDRYGDLCAFTGPMPREALEAAHLYSYAADGKHREDGGLLMRRDIHRLFDLGHIAVDPAAMTIDVVGGLHKYSVYAPLHGSELHVAPTARQREWLTKHWALYR
ncbi:HNH endonuclease [Actinokineospora diospyrosa]|uniref:HNH endonuclease n=2 Tax=Actinokineospora diospyrosa TaxID=103728 RepID=A0ABT1ILM7_9PSEU|nr:HNH endonuclease [Actinokineospora diospyrosa]